MGLMDRIFDSDFFDAIIEAVGQAEDEGGAGEHKKEVAISIAVELIDSPLGDALEKKILSVLIDLVVHLLNKLGWDGLGDL